MVVVTLVAILAAVALPNYTKYIQQSKAKAAAADLVTLSLAIENCFLKKLSYPKTPSNNTIALPTELDGCDLPKPTQTDDFDYTVQANEHGYTLGATVKKNPVWCSLTLDHQHTRTSTNCAVLKNW